MCLNNEVNDTTFLETTLLPKQCEENVESKKRKQIP